ncbi:MAG TPA: molybdopterin molybdenumtransferase MoeA, partial [Cellvibrionaceae bacterium]
KPGKPLAYGRVGATPFVGLPGNPVSAFVTFVLLVAPFIEVLQGGQAVPLPLIETRALFKRDRPGGRDEYLRGKLTTTGVEIYPQQSSGALSSVSWADCLVRVPAGGRVEPGQTVTVLPLARWQ